MHTGDMFDMKYVGMFAEDHFFEDHDIVCVTKTEATLFCFSRADMKKIAQHHLVKSVWQSLIINNLSRILEAYMDKDTNVPCQRCLDETDAIFRPLEDWEMPPPEVAGSGAALQHPFAHFWNSFCKQFSAPWPVGSHLSGIRQTHLSAPVNPPCDDPIRISSMHGMNYSLTPSLTPLSEGHGIDESQDIEDPIET